MWGSANDNFGGGGGGFVSSQGGGNNFGSPAPGGEKSTKGVRRSNNIFPVTIKTIQECQEENYTLLGIEAQVLTIVGLVVAVEQTTTKVAVHIDDQTGVLECVNYVGSDAGNSEVPFVPLEGSYGRVVGALRSSKGRKYLIIFKFLPVTDMNELTAHMLEVIQVPMRLKKVMEAEAQKTGVGVGGGMNNSLSNSMVVNAFAGGVGMMGGSGVGGAPPRAVQKPGISSTQNIVLSIIQSNNTDTGMHKDEILRCMKGKVGMKELEKILEDLGNEGHVYSTVDDDHFRSTD